MNEPIAIVLAGVLALVGSLAGGWLAATRLYYRQKWWDRRADTYSLLVSHLGVMHHTYSRLLMAYEGGYSLAEDFSEKLKDEAREARTKAEVIAKTGGFLITNAAGQAVREMLDAQYVGDEDHLGMLQRDVGSTDACIQKVIAQARDDLKSSS